MSETFYYITLALFDLAVGGVILFAALDDAKTRIVRPSIQWSLLGLAVAHFLFTLGVALWGDLEFVSLWGALQLPLSGILMFAIYITLVLVFKTGIGGADTKVSSIMALYLGLIPAIIMIVGHFVSAMAYVIYEKIKNHRNIASVPLMVFIGIGYLITLGVKWCVILI